MCAVRFCVLQKRLITTSKYKVRVPTELYDNMGGYDAYVGMKWQKVDAWEQAEIKTHFQNVETA